MAPVEFRVQQRSDVDAVDGEILDLAVDVGVDQLDAAHDDTMQTDTSEPGSGQVDGAQLGSAEIDPLEPGTAQIGTQEVRHARTLTPSPDRTALEVCA